MVTTGQAAFGGGQYGVVTQEDMALLAVLAQKTALENEDAGKPYRSLVRKLLPIIKLEDRLMLAQGLPIVGLWGLLRHEMETFQGR